MTGPTMGFLKIPTGEGHKEMGSPYGSLQSMFEPFEGFLIITLNALK
jgi:hypothetical protein